MSAIITDQFRILNANNFVESVENINNSYYVFIGLPNPLNFVFQVSNDSNFPKM